MPNDLYLTVLPLVHVSSGLTEETLTLFSSREFATEFFPDEVDKFLNLFEARAQKYLVGGHVTGYEFHKVQTPEGRVIVRVTQNVA